MTERARVSVDNAQLVRPGSVSQPGGVESLHECLSVWRELSDTEIDSKSRLQALDRMAQAFMNFFQVHGGNFECLQDFESHLHLPRVHVSQVRSWFGVVKGFPNVDQLASVAAHGAPVHVNGSAIVTSRLLSRTTTIAALFRIPTI